MALDKDDLKNDLVALIINTDPSLTPDQVAKMAAVFEKIAIAVTDQIKRGRDGNGNLIT